MKNICIYLVPMTNSFVPQDNKAIDLKHSVFVPLLASFDFEYELLDLDLVEIGGKFYVKVKILRNDD